MNDKRFTVKGLCIQENSNKRIKYYLSQQGSVDSLCMRINQLFEEYNKLEKENNKIKSILLKKVEELNDAYNKSAKAGMPTGGIIGELDSFEQICKIMEWIE